jgi:predicted metal-dependent hydrolase
MDKEKTERGEPWEESTGLPAYKVRESRRARHVLLKVSPGGLEVVVPQGFARHRIPDVLYAHRRWIERSMARRSATQSSRETTRLPDRFNLQAIAARWTVVYKPEDRAGIRLREHPEDQVLILSGEIHDAAACREALRRWLLRKARQHLVPWLSRLANEQGFVFGRVTIRCQRTRWGSCTRRISAASADPSHTISLNAKLLFLPPRLVRYVLLHELCHTVEPNHSSAFWDLCGCREPQTEALRKELRRAWTLVPGWIAPETP